MTCRCPIGYEGNASIECFPKTDTSSTMSPLSQTQTTSPPTSKQVPCIKVNDCPVNTTCVNSTCVNPCSHYKPCPRGVQCDVIGHSMYCKCPLPLNKTKVPGCKIFPGKLDIVSGKEELQAQSMMNLVTI